MKANEAPEKIWMSDDTEAIWVTNPYSTRFIEYTRTDAFIEKACSILKDISCQFEIIEQFKNRIR